MEPSLITLLCVPFLAIAVGLIGIAAAIKTVPEYKRLVVFRLGRYLGERGPGLVFLLPFVDRGIAVDLREQNRDLALPASTLDRTPATLELSYRYKISDPGASIMQVDNLENAMRSLLQTHWQALAGTLSAGDLPFRRQEIESTLQDRLDEASRRWGVQVTGLKIRDLK